MVNEVRHAVLDCFFWRPKSDGLSIQGVVAFLSPDPLLDHDIVRASVEGGNIGPMPAFESLCAASPVRLKVDKFAQKAPIVEAAVIQQLSRLDATSESNPFLKCERVKWVALDCSRTLLTVSNYPAPLTGGAIA